MFTSKSMMIVHDGVFEDGFYLEDEIEGYTTIDVTGRESISREVETNTIGSRDGELYKNKRYEPRTITVSFVIEGADSTDLLSKLDHLNYILDHDEMIVVFDDEPDKYYMGTPNGSPSISIATPGGSDFGVASGSFDITCHDPFKYSVQEFIYDFEIDDDPNYRWARVNYDGTYESHPTFETLFYTGDSVVDEDPNSPTGYIENYEFDDEIASNYDGSENMVVGNDADCNYVAFFDDDDHIMQFGNPDTSIDSEDVEPMTTLEDQDFTNSGCYSANVKSRWLSNQVPPNVLPNNYIAQGAFGMKYKEYTVTQNNVSTSATLLSAKAGSGSPAIKYTVSAVASDRQEDRVKMVVTVKWSKAKGAWKKGSLTAGIGLHDTSDPYTHSDLITKSIFSNKTWTSKNAATSGSITITFMLTGLSASTSQVHFAFHVSRSGGSSGTLGWTVCNKMPIPTYLPPQSGSCFLSGSTFGSPLSGKHYGPTITRFLTAGCNKFEFNSDMYFAAGSAETSKLQQGAFGCYIVTGSSISGTTINDPKVLAGFTIYDDDASSLNGAVQYLINGTKYSSDENINLDYYVKETQTVNSGSKTTYTKGKTTITEAAYKKLSKKKKSGYKKVVTTTYTTKTVNKGDNRLRHFSISKDANNIVISLDRLNGIKCPIDPTLASMNAYAIVIGVFKNANYPELDWMGIRNAQFIKYNTDTLEEAPNQFGAGDILVIDTENNSVVLNNESVPSIGALGNDWENMYLIPGVNTYSATCSLIDKLSSDDNVPSILTKCKAEAYIPCDEYDYDIDTPLTYYIRVGDHQYSELAPGDDNYPTEEQFEATYSLYYQKIWIDPYIGPDAYYDSSGTHLTGVLKDEYEEAPWEYYIYKPCVPRFRIRYREVYL